jgi:hypothetical protein
MLRLDPQISAVARSKPTEGNVISSDRGHHLHQVRCQDAWVDIRIRRSGGEVQLYSIEVRWGTVDHLIPFDEHGDRSQSDSGLPEHNDMQIVNPLSASRDQITGVWARFTRVSEMAMTVQGCMPSR